MTKSIWLFMDRPEVADDNAEHFYDYIKKYHSEIKPYFALKKTSSDWDRLQKKGYNLVDYKSSAFTNLKKKANYLISSQLYPKFAKGKNQKQKLVFLQHGVAATNLAEYLNKKPQVDYSLCSVKREYDAFRDSKNGYKWNPKCFVLTGLPRHDNYYRLLKTSQKNNKILIDFTWRQNLKDCNTFVEFKKTTYYKFINNLVSSKKFNDLLKQYGYKATFKLHPNADKFKQYFTLGNSITLASNTITFPVLFNTHDLLITDYSSIAFDMAYLNRPVIYYQPDYKVMLKGGVNQWEKGWFDYERDGFGPTVYSLTTLLINIEGYLKNKCNLSNTDKLRISKTLTFRDNKNCERIYYTITNKKIPTSKTKKTMSDLKDAVFVLGNKSLHGKNEEIKVAIASLKKYCSSWLRNIYVVGENPKIKGIKYIPATDPYKHDKDANIIHKVRIACETIKDLSDDFLMCSDDQLVTKESSFEDFAPRYISIYDPSTTYWKNKKKSSVWNKRLCMTLERFGKGAKYFEPHIFSPINKTKFLEMCKAINYKQENGITIFTLYYNFIKEKGVKHFDHIAIQKKPYIIPTNVRHIGYFDEAFADNEFRKQLNLITGANIETETVNVDNEHTNKATSTTNNVIKTNPLYKPIIKHSVQGWMTNMF